ncbi:MAG TPA: hypothetical protein VF593_11380 [Chthoniobacteraceae bacterium]|jgi:hypothetical protein
MGPLLPHSGFIRFALPRGIGRCQARRRSSSGIALVQVVVAAAMVALCGGAGLRALIEINRKAAAMRILNNARAVVQRNIDTALGVPFSSSVTPPMLALTTAAGSVYDDDGGGDNLVNIVVPRNTANSYIRGTLTRTVLAETNSDGVDIRRITFTVSYIYGKKPYSFGMTTLRSFD